MATKAKSKPKFKVVPWKDLHGVATIFVVTDQDGYERRRFPSEIEALVAAEELWLATQQLATEEDAATEETPRGFTLRVA
jgi:hypothetical protein